jgi:hypothetical protein
VHQVAGRIVLLIDAVETGAAQDDWELLREDSHPAIFTRLSTPHCNALSIVKEH